MKKLLVAVATVASIAAVAVPGVSANPDAGVVIDSGFKCVVYDGNGDTYVTLNSVLIAYQTKAVLKCAGNNGVGAPSLTFFNNGNTGAVCGMLEFGFTANWSDKVGYNGSSQLTCTKYLDGPSESASSVDAGIG